MIKNFGFCENFGNCKTADNKTPVEMTKDSDGLCPECGEDLEGNKPIQWKLLGLIAVLLLILLTGVVFFAQNYFFKQVVTTDNSNIQNSNVIPPPVATPSPVISALCPGELNQNVLQKITDRDYIIMGVEFDAFPLNSSPKYDEDLSAQEYESLKPEKDATPKELKRREGELNRKRTGFDYEFAKMIANHMGIKGKNPVRAREVGSFGDLFCLLNRTEPNGEFSVDMIMSGIVEDDRYSTTIDWSKSYFTFSYALITNKNNKAGGIADFKDKSIGIIKGDSAVEAYVKKELPDAKIVYYSDEDWSWTDCAINKNPKACEKVESNTDLPKVDACIYDFPFAQQEMKEVTPRKGEALEILDAALPNSSREYRIGVAKGNNDLREKINDAIKFITKEDSQSKLQYQDLVREYMTPPKESIKQPKPSEGDEKYIVEEGDTLSGIALKLYNDSSRWTELQRKNNIGNENLIRPKQPIYYSK